VVQITNQLCIIVEANREFDGIKLNTTFIPNLFVEVNNGKALHFYGGLCI
jgi:hypothetical protein